SGDRDARNELICHYWPYVTKLIQSLEKHIPLSLWSDLKGFGAIGLIDAVDKYRPELGNRFETYSAFRIRGAIRDGLREFDWFPRGARGRTHKLIHSIHVTDFHAPTSDYELSLEEKLGDDNDSPQDVAMLVDQSDEIAAVVEALPERERTIIVDRYYKGRPLSHIGRHWNVTESRVCQLHRRALRLLEELLTEQRSA
ncbi:MAG: sigma-70 family RNA polymerase sigma factor, partial [Actinomycetota bacterium]